MKHPAEWGPAFLETPRGILLAQLRRGPATVNELAQVASLTPNGVRMHLSALERDGWIRAASRRKGASAGKPAVEYELNPGAESLLSAAYRPLAVSLLAELHQRLERRELDGLLKETGRRLADEIRAGREPLDLAAAVAVLEDLGASLEIHETGQRMVVLEGHGCPVGEAVAVEPRTCQALTALLSRLLDREVRTACRHGERPQCRFEIPKPEPAASRGSKS